jgi:hypothetical protein
VTVFRAKFKLLFPIEGMIKVGWGVMAAKRIMKISTNLQIDANIHIA